MGNSKDIKKKLERTLTLLKDYHELIKCDYGKIEGEGLYMEDLEKALGYNAARGCKRIYMEVEEYLKEEEINV
jgi:hypothetical protein